MKYLAIALLAATSISAQAQTFNTENLSATLNLGKTTQKVQDFNDAKDSTTSIELGLQYQLDSNWSIGASYANLGDVTLATLRNEVIPVQNLNLVGNINVNSELTALNLFGQVQTAANVGEITFGARLGFSRWSHDLPLVATITAAPSAARNLIGQSFTTKGSDSGIDLYGGLFAEYLASETITLGLYINSLNFDSTPDWADESQEFNALTYSVGLKYNF
jgi:hypothetical protein